jgi:hypothetical protein
MEQSNVVRHEDLVELHEKFRDTKHSINNSLAVIMALSELAQRNPVHFEKLAAAVLARSPDIVNQLQEFQTLLTQKVNPGSTGEE